MARWHAAGSKRRLAKRHGERGYTLIEVLLVIALMVAVAALVWPNVTALLEGDRLPRTADDLRGLLVGLRQRAMDEGRAMTLEFQPGSGDFTVRGDPDPNAPVDARMQGDTANSFTNSSNNERKDLDRATPDFDSAEVFGTHALARRLRFERDAQADALAEAAGPRPGTQLPVSNAGIVIRFEIDGSANDAAFWLVDDTNEGIRFEVRGATGVVKVSRVLKYNGN